MENQCMIQDDIPSKLIQMSTSQNTTSMDDKKLLTFQMNLRGQNRASMYEITSHSCQMDLTGYKSEYSINACHKITYIVNKLNGQNTASIRDTRSHTS